MQVDIKVYDEEYPMEQFITRGCVNDSLESARPETFATQTQWTICEGDLCNILDVDIDPDDVNPLPPPGQWDKPLSDAEAAIFCGPAQENCIRCHTCNAISDPYQSCVTFPGDGDLRFYRRRYFDLRTDEWINNVCSTETRAIAAPTLPEVNDTTIVVRRSVQLNDEELAELKEGSSTHSGMVELTYCQGYLCNDQGINDAASHVPGNSCFYCKVAANETGSSCATGVLDSTVDLTEECLTGICEMKRSARYIERGCTDAEVVAEKIRGSHNVSVEETTVFCHEEQCNANYITANLEILAERPAFIPSPVPTPVADPSACSDASNPADNTDLCIQCHTCETVVNNDTVDPFCISEVNETTMNYYFRFEGGFPVMCGIQTERRKSTTGYFYNIERGAIKDVDPAVAFGSEEIRVQSLRTSRVACQDSACNSYAYNELPLPPAISPKIKAEPVAAGACYQCSATAEEAASSEEAKACFEAPTNPQSCSNPNDDCFIRLTESWNITKELYETDLRISRGCEDNSAYDYGAIESAVYAKEVWVCVGELCNDQPEPDMPPYPDVEISGFQWTKPLPLDHVTELCTTFECLECLTCLHLYNFDDPYPRDYACSSRTYRKSFLNPEDSTELLYNHCVSRTGLRENAFVKKRYIIHGVEQSADPPMNDPIIASGITDLFSTDNGMCKSCEVIGNCLLIESALPDESCPSNVCRSVIVDGFVKRRGCATPAEVQDFNNGQRKIAYQEQWKVCDQDNCNVVAGNNYKAVC